MSDDTYAKDLEIKNKKGLHARAAAAFVKTVEPFDAEVEVERIGQCVNGCSIMGLISRGFDMDCRTFCGCQHHQPHN